MKTITISSTSDQPKFNGTGEKPKLNKFVTLFNEFKLKEVFQNLVRFL